MSDQAPDYHPFYCEENIWRLNRRSVFTSTRRDVVFITSLSGACPLFGMRASASPEEPIFWDYHVVLLDWREEQAKIWDLDSIHGAPIAASDWFARTVPDWSVLAQEYHPVFRVVDGEQFDKGFSSDRSHMCDEQGHFAMAPPPWSAPYIDDVGMVLESYKSARQGGPGDVLTAGEFFRHIS